MLNCMTVPMDVSVIRKHLLLKGKLICVAVICLFLVSGTGCQLLINAVAGNLAAEAVKKGGGTSKADPDGEPYRPLTPAERYYSDSLFWEKKGQVEKAIQDMQKFCKLAPDDPRGPERLKLLEAKLKNSSTPRLINTEQ